MNRLEIGDTREVMRRLIDEGVKVQMCVTSPPYLWQREYLPRDSALKGYEIGNEDDPLEYVKHLVEIFNLVRDLLTEDGNLFLNLGDKYNGSGGAGGDYAEGGRREGQPKYPARRWTALPSKHLLGMPWRVALALQHSGWYFRCDNIWFNPKTTEGVTDRCTHAHEYVFHFTKNPHYFYDIETTRQPLKRMEKRQSGYQNQGKSKQTSKFRAPNPNGRGLTSVWTIPSVGYPDSHFAVMPNEVAEICILSGSRPGDIVLDPFAGSGTVGEVAELLGRQWLLIELNPEYEKLIRKRTQQPNMFCGVR